MYALLSFVPTDNYDGISLDSCTYIPPSDITAIPQQYMIQMTTSGVPPSRLASFIRCVGDCPKGITLEKSYYTLINQTTESYQFTLPVIWSTDSKDIEHKYTCRIRIGGVAEDGRGTVIESKTKSTAFNGLLILIVEFD